MRAIHLTSLLLLAACGGPELRCPAPALPSPDPTYVATVEGLVVVPARANLRSASEAELQAFVDLTAARQEACGQSPPGGDCELTSLRAALVALPAPDHPSVFTDIDGSLDAALNSAHGDFAAADRDCDGQAEAVCDARAITGAFARAACELRGDSTGGH
ncbi:MAG: hypothetical protein KC619_35665 [Myxococcales bacterium]|nr:hypothetical protein [Myxococcales bacterium]